MIIKVGGEPLGPIGVYAHACQYMHDEPDRTQLIGHSLKTENIRPKSLAIANKIDARSTVKN